MKKFRIPVTLMACMVMPVFLGIAYGQKNTLMTNKFFYQNCLGLHLELNSSGRSEYQNDYTFITNQDNSNNCDSKIFSGHPLNSDSIPILRKQLLTHFEDSELDEVRKIKDLLWESQRFAGENLSYPEYWLILFWLHDFDPLLFLKQQDNDCSFQTTHSTTIEVFQNGLIYESLYPILQEKSCKFYHLLKDQVNEITKGEDSTFLLSLMDKLINTDVYLFDDIRIIRLNYSQKHIEKQLQFGGIDSSNWPRTVLQEIEWKSFPEEPKNKYSYDEISWLTNSSIEKNKKSNRKHTITQNSSKNSKEIAISKRTGKATDDKDFKRFEHEINRNSVKGVKRLIDKGKNIEAVGNFGKTPLLYALKLNRNEIAQFLIESGANLKIRDNFGDGTLHYAIKYCDSNDIVYELVNKGVDIDQKNSEGYSPFHYSILYKCEDISFFLIDKGADYMLNTINHENALHLAVEAGCDSVLKFLLTKNLNLELESRYLPNTPLKLAIKKQRESMVYELINAGAKIKMSYLHDAVWNNSRVVVERLLADGLTNPMDCDNPDRCFVTGFVYLTSAGLADDMEKLLLYKNALSIYKLTKEKYRYELGEIRAANTAMMTAIILGALLGAYSGSSYSQPVYVPDDGYSKEETKYKKYLKIQIKLCNERIREIKRLISNSNNQY